jgi:phosphatidate cytidylyltransferase
MHSTKLSGHLPDGNGALAKPVIRWSNQGVLKLRIISALILVPLVVWVIFGLEKTSFAVAMLIVVSMCAWEWSRFIPLRSILYQVIYTIAAILIVAVIWQFTSQAVLVNSILGLALVWWLFALFWITRPGLFADGAAAQTLKSIAGWLMMTSCWLALVVLHSQNGPYWVLFVLSLIWVADIGAYFSGRQWGGRKLAPQVSPGKTWAGVYGALAACGVYAVVASWLFNLSGKDIPGFLLVSMLTVLFSIAGDLLESLLKRHQDMKDSGQLIPGHGGILDRLDSLLAAAPVFVLGLHWVDM